jgi:outer membrane protein assembly factor BamB
MDGSVATDGTYVYITSGDRVYCVSQVDGTQKWRCPPGAGLGYSFKGAPAVGGGLVIATADNRTVYAMNKDTGDLVWQYVSPVSIVGNPVIANNVVLIGQAGNSIMAVNLSDGKPFYESPVNFADGIQGSWAVWGDDIVAFNGTGAMVAINIGSQRIEWKRPTDGVASDVYPVTSRDTIYFVSNNFLVALNGGGTPRFETQAPEALEIAPAVTHKGIIALTREGTIYRFDTNGRLLRDAKPIELHSPPASRPMGLANGQFVVTTENGGINLIDIDKGLVWTYIVRPIGGIQSVPAGNSGGLGGGLNGGGGPGGLGGGSQGLGTGGNGINRGAPDANIAKIVSVQVAGVPVEVGTSLLVRGRDGSVLAFDKMNGVDLTPPKVTMTYPNAGEVVSGMPPLALVFKIEDESSGVNASTIKITVDGKQSLDYDYNREGVAIVRFTETGKNRVLSNGKHKFTVEVSDWMGNVRTESYYLTIDNLIPPAEAAPDNGNPPGKGGFGGI